MKRLRLAMLLFSTLASGLAFAQPMPPQPPMPPGPPGPPSGDPHRSPDDLLRSKLFPPEAIMANQQELGITDAQRNSLVAELQKAQTTSTPLQWQLTAAAEQLAKMAEGAKVDEAKVLAQADKVMGLERELKRTHLGLLVRIKNLLTEEQQAKLRAMLPGPGPRPPARPGHHER